MYDDDRDYAEEAWQRKAADREARDEWWADHGVIIQTHAEMTGPRPSSHGVMAGPTEPCPGVLYRFEISLDGGAEYVHCGDIDGEVVAQIMAQPITSHRVIRRFVALPEWEDDRG